MWACRVTLSSVAAPLILILADCILNFDLTRVVLVHIVVFMFGAAGVTDEVTIVFEMISNGRIGRPGDLLRVVVELGHCLKKLVEKMRLLALIPNSGRISPSPCDVSIVELRPPNLSEGLAIAGSSP